MIYDLINTFLKKTDPEIAHSIAIKALKSNLNPIEFHFYYGIDCTNFAP